MKKRVHISRFVKSILFIVVGAVIAVALTNVFLLCKTFQGPEIDALNASYYGTFVGGYIGTSLAFVSTVLLYLAFRNQEQSNSLEKFESKFFEMIKIHRENVSEIELGQAATGRKAFVLLLREFRWIHMKTEEFLQSRNIEEIDKPKLFDICYKILLYGTGPNSTRILLQSIPGDCQEKIRDLIDSFALRQAKNECRRERGLPYLPFEGHQSRLGHYYRHIYQTVCYVDKQERFLLSDEDKYNYVKILRAQLSTHEQALFFLNSLSSLGSQWGCPKSGKSKKGRGRKSLIETYQLIKNIPYDFFDAEKEIDPKSVYPNVTFEWEEKENNPEALP